MDHRDFYASEEATEHYQQAQAHKAAGDLNGFGKHMHLAHKAMANFHDASYRRVAARKAQNVATHRMLRRHQQLERMHNSRAEEFKQSGHITEDHAFQLYLHGGAVPLNESIEKYEAQAAQREKEQDEIAKRDPRITKFHLHGGPVYHTVVNGRYLMHSSAEKLHGMIAKAEKQKPPKNPVPHKISEGWSAYHMAIQPKFSDNEDSLAWYKRAVYHDKAGNEEKKHSSLMHAYDALASHYEGLASNSTDRGNKTVYSHHADLLRRQAEDSMINADEAKAKKNAELAKTHNLNEGEQHESEDRHDIAWDAWGHARKKHDIAYGVVHGKDGDTAYHWHHTGGLHRITNGGYGYVPGTNHDDANIHRAIAENRFAVVVGKREGEIANRKFLRVWPSAEDSNWSKKSAHPSVGGLGMISAVNLR